MNYPKIGIHLCSELSETVQSDPEQTRSVLSYNSPQFRDYLSAHIFLNLAKQWRPWSSEASFGTNSATEVSRGDDGYFFEIPAGRSKVQTIWAWGDGFPDTILRRYVMTYTGQGTVVIGTSASEVSRTSLPNGEKIIFDVTSKANITFEITAIPDPINYPRDFVIVPQGTDWQLRLDAGEVFTPEFIDHMMPNGKSLAEYRHLNSLLVNASTVTEFDEYAKVTDAVYTRGIPVELLCKLARDTGHIPWFCIPAQASDQFVLDMAAFVAAQLPDIIDQVKVEYTNEVWNGQFFQSSQMQFEAARDFGGRTHGTATVSSGTNLVTLQDTTGLQAGDQIQFYRPDTKRHYARSVNAVNGLEVEVGFFFSTADAGSNVEVVSSSFYDTSSAYARRATQVMALWEQGAGVRPVRVMGAFLASPDIANKIISADLWRNSGDPNFTEPVDSFDVMAVSTYMYGLSKSELQNGFLTASRSSYEEGRDVLLAAMLDKNQGLDSLISRLNNNRAVADANGLGLIAYEGFADHSIQGNLDEADRNEIVDAYASVLYSDDYAPVWDRHFNIQKRYLDGPAMIYVDIAQPSVFGLFGFRRRLPDVSGRTISILGLVNSTPRWWGDDVPPQTAMDWVTTITRTTKETGVIDYRRMFSVNADTFSATGLPDGVAMAANGVLTFEPTTTVDLNVTAQITVSTAGGVSATFDQVFDITYIVPTPVPATTFETSFADATGVGQSGGANVTDGLMLLPNAGSYSRLSAVEYEVRANNPDAPTGEFTISWRYSSDGSGSGDLVDGPVNLSVNQPRIRTSRIAEGTPTLLTIPVEVSSAVTDDVPHRVTAYLNYTTNRFKLWLDGVVLADVVTTDIDPNQVLEAFTNFPRFWLGSQFNATLTCQFYDVQFWDERELTDAEVESIPNL